MVRSECFWTLRHTHTRIKQNTQIKHSEIGTYVLFSKHERQMFVSFDDRLIRYDRCRGTNRFRKHIIIPSSTSSIRGMCMIDSKILCYVRDRKLFKIKTNDKNRIFEGNEGVMNVCWNRSSRKDGIVFSLSSTSNLKELNLKCLGPDTLSKEMERGKVSTSMSKRAFALRCGHVVYWYATKQWHEPLCFVSCGAICCVDHDEFDILCVVVEHYGSISAATTTKQHHLNLVWIQSNGKRREDLDIFDEHVDISQVQIVADRNLVVLLTRNGNINQNKWIVRWIDSKGKRSKIFRISSKQNITLRGISKPYESILVDVEGGSRWVMFPALNIWSPEVIGEK